MSVRVGAQPSSRRLRGARIRLLADMIIALKSPQTSAAWTTTNCWILSVSPKDKKRKVTSIRAR